MGYPTISEFDKVFIQRTKENLDSKVKNEYTHLMNCLLGLIVLPRQATVQGKRQPKFFNKKVLEIADFSFLKGKTKVSDEFNSNVEIKKLDFPHQPIEKLTIAILLERLRNSIAHQSIRPTCEGRKWIGVIFRNYSTELKASAWKNDYDLQVYLTMDELKTFAVIIADNYSLS